LAHWITDPVRGAGHLVARVIVNRIWQHHFGRGLVTTPNDFGRQGELPTHPKLLDWLAQEFIERGWNLKYLHYKIVTSSTYMQSDASDGERAHIDPDNRLYWRRSPYRLEAEAIRDAMLAVSGTLDTTMYGPGSLDEGMNRRSIYFTIKRSQLIPMMMLFDWPEHLVSIPKRPVTTTAPQALMFMNNPHVRALSGKFAERLMAHVTRDSTNKGMPNYEGVVDQAFLSAFGRLPMAEERAVACKFIASHVTDRPGEATELDSLTNFCQTIFGANEFIYIR